nr:hypothetical protein [Candidatus Sigynarchaeota archaeon]
SPADMVNKIAKALDSSDDDVKREILPILKELLNEEALPFKDEFLDWLGGEPNDKRKITSWAKK